MSLSKLEKGQVYLGIVLGIVGTGIAIFGYLDSREALKVSRATASAKVQITGAYLDSLPQPGQFVAFDVELQNFGQSSAEKVRATVWASELPRPGASEGLQGSVPPGFKETVRLADLHRWPENASKNVAFFIKVSFTDAASGDASETETAFYIADAKPQSDGRVMLRPMAAP